MMYFPAETRLAAHLWTAEETGQAPFLQEEGMALAAEGRATSLFPDSSALLPHSNS